MACKWLRKRCDGEVGKQVGRLCEVGKLVGKHCEVGKLACSKFGRGHKPVHKAQGKQVHRRELAGDTEQHKQVLRHKPVLVAGKQEHKREHKRERGRPVHKQVPGSKTVFGIWHANGPTNQRAVVCMPLRKPVGGKQACN